MKYKTQKLHYKGKNNPNYKKGLPKCIDCGKLLKSYKSKRCNKCYEKGKNNGNYKDGRCSKKYYCKESNCNNQVCLQTALYGGGRCRSCSKKGDRNYVNRHPEIIRGKNNPNWQNGIMREPYSFEFNNELKEKIRKRDNYACQQCGMTQKEHLITYSKCLGIHHIDYNKKNCNKGNLISLCIPCNFRVNYNRDYWYAYFTYLMENKK
jgi:hypothetical protein